jgi:hypothetical protein
MVPLLLAGALAASHVVAPQFLQPPTPASPSLRGAPVVRILQRPAATPGCKRDAIQTASPMSPALLLRPEDRAQIQLKRLGDLPKPNFEIAVNRTDADGCPVPVVVSYRVGP